MGNEASAPPPPPAVANSQTVETITKLRGTSENLEKRKLHLERKMAQEVEQARSKIKAGKKKGKLFPFICFIIQFFVRCDDKYET